MDVIGLDGKEYKLKLHTKKRKKQSSLHLMAQALLQSIFPADPIHQEIFIPGSEILYLDFFIPTRRLAVEVNGEQHYHFSPLYHKSMSNFAKGLKKDGDKREWCDLNNIRLVELPYTEGPVQWKTRILDV